MDDTKGITFFPFTPKGGFLQPEAKESLFAMKERTRANTVIFVPGGWQETAQSVKISYTTDKTLGDDELRSFIEYAKGLNLNVMLKPTVNCLDGTWRAHINFFDEDVPCEPKWSEWFEEYTAFQVHYATIAQEMKCDMFIAGCEMVMAERREKEWREVIAAIKNVYSGPVSYNTDKYQEDRVKWWDCVDVISSSGYYPVDDWEKQLDRIEKVVKKYGKPFFFAEAGCMSTTGSKEVPNDWGLCGEIDLQGQASWYQEAFAAIKKRTWVNGVVLWSWNGKLYTQEEAKQDRYYEIYQKPAEEVVYQYFT
ncbi:1,4-beta-xylanase [Lachnospiraceae bacterium ZAX-1]